MRLLWIKLTGSGARFLAGIEVRLRLSGDCVSGLVALRRLRKFIPAPLYSFCIRTTLNHRLQAFVVLPFLASGAWLSAIIYYRKYSCLCYILLGQRPIFLLKKFHHLVTT
jgi:hypothetical protein